MERGFDYSSVSSASLTASAASADMPTAMDTAAVPVEPVAPAAANPAAPVAPVAPIAAEPAAVDNPAPAMPESYTVVKGDTLGGIARKYYGRASAWPRIAEANADLLKGKTLIRPGMKLQIPRP